jgi:hypothetical protein
LSFLRDLIVHYSDSVNQDRWYAVSSRSALGFFIVGGKMESESAVNEMPVSLKETWLGWDTDIPIFATRFDSAERSKYQDSFINYQSLPEETKN